MPRSACCLPVSSDPALVASRLAAEGIETRRWYYPPLNLHPAFADAGVAGNLEATTSISERLLGLPFHLDMDSADIGRVAETLARILDHA